MVNLQIAPPPAESPYLVHFLVSVVVILLGVIVWISKNGVSAIKQYIADLKEERDQARAEQRERYEAAEQSKRDRGERLRQELRQSDKRILEILRGNRGITLDEEEGDADDGDERLGDEKKGAKGGR